VTNIGTVTIGNTASSGSNTLQVTGAGSLLYAAVNVNVGSSTSLVAGNQLLIEDGGKADIRGHLTVSTNSVLNNTLLGLLYLGGNMDVRSTNYAASDLSGRTVFNGGGVTQLLEALSAFAVPMSTTNFFFGRVEIGDAATASNAAVRLVDQRQNTSGIGSERLAADSLIVALNNSVLDLNGLGVFANSLVNSGVIQQINAGGVGRVDTVSTFTNQGTVAAAGGGFLQFSNAFINAAGALVRMQGGVLTNFVTAGALTNYGVIGGFGAVTPVLANEPQGMVVATGGVLRLVTGFTNSGTGPVNGGLLAALGAGSELRVEQAFTNAGQIWVTAPAARSRSTWRS